MNYRIAPRAEFCKMAPTGGPPVVDRQDGPPVIRVQGGPPVIQSRRLTSRLNAFLIGVLAAGALMAASSANAVTLRTFDLVWSPLGSATGSITGSITLDIDAAATSLPQSAGSAIPAWVTALSITASGTSADGTWGLADFPSGTGFWTWDNAGVVFDFSQPLIGQGSGNGWANPTDVSPLGNFGFETSLGSGLLFNSDIFEQQLGVGGDVYNLTTFSPAAVPLPATLPLLGLGLVGVAALKRRKA